MSISDKYVKRIQRGFDKYNTISGTSFKIEKAIIRDADETPIEEDDSEKEVENE